ncbi:uncharacterized protein TRUGW13939_01881 [Talaromyces rugulosus]|uniref:Uncharacterized protein n=1 Tax=Talaromyces rugulosus TaxID=121627 RepID=A0A7H8QLW7_TALRU|nr:uncharacterized protein TRUGW13939_01881 [Talaromyces rugulosus]QKX54792.1 hypothetical protein TRUGW13939_01881 [Talaromyces rugulosus]
MSLSSIAHGIISTVFSNLFITLPYPNADLHGQTIIVSGSNTGLGFEASLHLSRLGVEKLIMAVRTPAKGEAAKQKILKSTGRDESSIEVWKLDMDSYDSVKEFSARVSSTLSRVDAVLANAGLALDVFQLSENNEKNVNVNVVSTFLLLLLLLPKLRESANTFNITPRFTIVNSALHYVAPLKELDPDHGPGIFARLNNPSTSNMGSRYALSKLLVVYAVREFAEHAKGEKSRVIVNTPNPSFCKSGLIDNMESGNKAAMRLFERLMARSTEMGSRALVHGVISGPETHGQYLTNCHNQMPSSSVTNAKGARIQKKFYNELVAELAKIAPEISSENYI